MCTVIYTYRWPWPRSWRTNWGKPFKIGYFAILSLINSKSTLKICKHHGWLSVFTTLKCSKIPTLHPEKLAQFMSNTYAIGHGHQGQMDKSVSVLHITTQIHWETREICKCYWPWLWPRPQWHWSRSSRSNLKPRWTELCKFQHW